MIAPILRRRRICPRRSTFLALLALACLASAGRADSGRWTPRANWAQGDLNRYAVHMMLLRGDNSPYHSRILWFQGEDLFQGDTMRTFEGGEWLWKATPDNCTCETYPVAQFDSVLLSTSGMNPFCAGHAVLADGRVLIAGGDDAVFGDYGEIQARTFTAGAGGAPGSWPTPYPPNMHLRRFYPTVTTLRDGRAMATAGDNYRHHRVWGGLNLGNTLTDTLRRFAPIEPGSWDRPIVPPADPSNGPSPRSGHTAVKMANPWGDVFFGGRDASDQPLQDTWVLRRFQDSFNPLLSDAQYSWAQLSQISGAPPPLRSDHSAIVALGDNMVIFGGRGNGSSAINNSEVWRLFWDTNLGSFHWKQLITSGSPPSSIPLPRFGQSAIYDETTVGGVLRQRMIVFGGTSDLNSSPTDPNVYELRFTDPDHATWSVMDTVDLDHGGPKPAPRYWATLTPGTQPHNYPVAGNGHVALMLAGKLGAGACSDTLWGLWLFESGKVGWKMKLAPGVPGVTSPAPRARHSAVFDPDQSGYDGRLYIYGGEDASHNLVDSKVWVLDPWGGHYGSWTVWSNPGVSLAGHTSVLGVDPEKARVPEIYDPIANSWAPQDSAYLNEEFYPPSFVVPGSSGGNSRVINLGQSGQQAYWLDVPPAGQPATEKWTALPHSGTGVLAQTGVQYRPGRILIAGGWDLSYSVSGETQRLNASLLSSSWLSSGTHLASRLNENLVLLPTGNVLAVGGNRPNKQNEAYLPVRWTQEWRVTLPGDTTGEWSDSTELAQQPTVRGNHSTAILLPDGRVLSAGGDQGFGSPPISDMYMGNIFCPPYLFKADGTLATRAKITGAPDTLGWAGGCTYTLTVQDTTNIRRACLIRPGATTHTFDQNQRYVPLTMGTVSNPSRVLVSVPVSPDEAPPGDYLLFVTGSPDRTDVPSIAQWVTVGSSGLDKQDQIRPAPNDDFSAVCDPNTPNGWIVSWTATADDSIWPVSGTVATDNVRRSIGHITDANWSSATSSYTHAGYAPGNTVWFSTSVSGIRYYRMKSVDNANHLSALGPEIALDTWMDCLGGGLWAGGGGGGGFSLARAPGSASVRPGGEGSTPAAVASTFFENSVLNGTAIGSGGHDVLRLPASIASGGAVRLREVSSAAAALDAARLLVVDHGSGVAAYGLEGAIVTGTRQSASRITAADGTDLTTVLNGSGSFAISPNEVLTVALGSGGGASPVVVTAGGTGALQVQVPDRQGGWRTASQATPRIDPDDLVFAAPGADTVRIVTRGYASVSNIGRLAVSGTAPTIQVANLLAAHSARLGDVKAAAAELDSVSATLVGPDTLALSYALPQATTGVRDYFLLVDATPLDPQTLPPARLQPTGQELPLRFALEQNRPNPFSSRTTIRFALPTAAQVRLEVFDLQGRRVAMLANGSFTAGYRAIDWDHRDSHGNQVHSGVYLYRLTAGSFRSQKKMVLLP